MGHVKSALFNYQGGGTALSPQLFDHMKDTRRDNCLIFMLSDTYFNSMENQNQVLESIDRIVSAGGIGFYLFQMGSHSPFSSALEAKGIPVHLVRSAEDFMDKAISFNREFYGRIVRE